MVQKITTDFREAVYSELKKQGPSSLSLAEVSDEIDADRERTRLALRELFRLGYVAETAEWEYRVTYPTTDSVR